MKSLLTINNKPIGILQFRRDKNQKNRYLAKKWVTFDGDPENVRVSIGTDNREYSTLYLQPAKSKTGRDIFTAEEDQKRFYFWANLVKGYGVTWGVTVGYLDNTGQNQEDIEKSIPPTWKNPTEGDNIQQQGA